VVTNLDTASREMVRTNEPRFLVIHIPFWNEYIYSWAISSNRTVEVEAHTDYWDLDAESVRIRETQPARYK